MDMVAKKSFHDVLALPATDRYELAKRIWESLRDEQDKLLLSDWEKELLDERLRDMDQNPNEEFEASLRQND